MASLRELRRKVKSVKSTQQITKAMKLVAAARLNKAQERILAARPYAKRMEHLLEELAYIEAHRTDFHAKASHPFLIARQGQRFDLVVVTADRGLCGGFNANVIRKAVQTLKEAITKQQTVKLWVVGRKGRDYFRRFNIPIEKEYVNFFHRLGFQQAEVLGKNLIKTFLETDTREIMFLYNEFKSRIQSQLVLKSMLPVLEVPAVKAEQDFLYEPSHQQIIDELMPRYFTAQIYRILLESQSAELAARMTAMESATNNAKELIYSLTLNMNKVRQAAITKELSEIVSGADALQMN